jgi:hypothetical protein
MFSSYRSDQIKQRVRSSVASVISLNMFESHCPLGSYLAELYLIRQPRLSFLGENRFTFPGIQTEKVGRARHTLFRNISVRS